MALVLTAVALAALAAAVLVTRSLVRMAPSALVVRNFRGVDVPVVGGVVVIAAVLAAQAVLALARVLAPGGGATVSPGDLLASRDNAGLMVLALGFFALGAADDLLGRPGPVPDAKGLRGHADALRRGVVTGGVLKAGGGAVLGLVAGALWQPTLPAVLLDGALVALSANLLNLLDLRPGRASKAFLVAAAALAVAAPAVGPGAAPMLLAVVTAVVAWLPVDLGERGMLGDAGANALGGVAGGVAALALPAGPKFVVASLLLLLMLASERWSFTAVIERVPPLRFLDRLGRLPEPSPGAPGPAERA